MRKPVSTFFKIERKGRNSMPMGGDVTETLGRKEGLNFLEQKPSCIKFKLSTENNYRESTFEHFRKFLRYLH